MPLTSLFVLLIAYALFIGSLFRPISGVIGYLLIYSIFDYYSWWYHHLRQFLIRPSLMAMCLLFIGCLLHWRKLDWSITRKEIAFYIFLGTAWGVSYFFGVEMHQGTFKFLWKMTKMFIFLFFFIRVVYTLERYNAVIWTLILASLFLAYQSHVAGDFSTGRIECIGGIDFQEANSLAAFLIIGITLLGFKLVQTTGWKQIPIVVALAIMTNGFILTRSRGVFWGVVLAIPYVILKIPKKLKRNIYLYIFLGAIMFISLADVNFLKRIATINDEASDLISNTHSLQEKGLSRVDYWKSSVKMFKDHPMGIGVNNFPYLVVKYDHRNKGMDAHNTYILCYSEIGIFGIVLFIFIFKESYFELRRAQELSKNTDHEDELNIAIVSLMTVYIIYFLGGNMTHSYLYLEITWILLALPICLEKSAKKLIAIPVALPDNKQNENLKNKELSLHLPTLTRQTNQDIYKT